MADNADKTIYNVSECPYIGQRIVFLAKSHEGDSSSTWQDGEVVETARMDKKYTNNWAVKIKYCGTSSRWRKRKTFYRWVSANSVMAIVDDTKQIKEEIRRLEAMAR